MNSPFANIYLSLLAQINSIPPLPSATTPPIPYIDLDYGQLSAASPSVTFPCVLIDFKDWEFADLSQSIQKARGYISVKLAVSSYDDTSSITPAGTIASGLSVLDLEWQLYNALQGFAPTISVDDDGNPTAQAQPLSRVSVITDLRHPGLRIREMYFTTAYTDFSAKIGDTLTPATINLTAEFEDPI